MNDIRNALIVDTSLTMEKDGCLTLWVDLRGDNWKVNYGGYYIAKGFMGANDNQFTAETGDGLIAMMRIMDIVGVNRWEDLRGKYVRVEINGIGKPVTKIGNILNDKWFDINDFFTKQLEQKKQMTKEVDDNVND